MMRSPTGQTSAMRLGKKAAQARSSRRLWLIALCVQAVAIAACSGDGKSRDPGAASTTTTVVFTDGTTSTTLGGRVHACCIPGQACRETREGVCLAMGGEWEPPGSDPLCTPGLCLPASTTTTTSSSTTTNSLIIDDFGAAIRVSLLDTVTVGALQLDIADNGPGRFDGDADRVSCSSQGLAVGAIATYNYDVAQSLLRVGMISLAGFTGPGDLFVCLYTRSLGLDASDFSVSVVDAAMPDFSPIDPPPTIGVTIEPLPFSH